MARWLVTQGDRQFAAQDLNELKQLAADGKVGPGDMIQPPGASDWLYASELPELKGLLKSDAGAQLDDDFDMPRRGFPTGIIAVIFFVLAVGGGIAMYQLANMINDSDLELGLEYTEMLVTAEGGATVRADPDENASSVGSATKDSKVQLEAKRGPWYQVTTSSGAKGWVKVDDVIPGYFFADQETRTDYDPIYNPDRYVFVKNSGWMQLPDQRRENVTIFNFLLQNKSKFEMTDVVLLATIKDKNDNVLETQEIAIEGIIPPHDGVMVGTLEADPKDKESVDRLLTDHSFNELAENDESLHMRWVGGVTTQMESEGFVEANIDLLQLRAIPKKID